MVAPENARDGFEPLTVGSIIPNAVILRIIRSDVANFKAGDNVIGMAPIQEYVTIEAGPATHFSKVENPYKLDLKLFLGALGMPGLTAYSALYEIGQPKSGETIFISAASGAVGQLVGQLAKREGLKVIGSVGSDEKLQILTKVFKFDGGFNYRKGDIRSQLKRLAPDGIDSKSETHRN
ncbi:putative zinc-binding dehydrogenase protein [Phaeoacremonium minimum UCRPA7]|uniref:Putative zinc-binding dehydrogenase protein n=1 Tax=Phaeoacremonium minimum (strain UCR-PA7) TaxID=1286976 RepID=R8BIN6_PHAM7|nr:putative zinc-binding dehydrogenase protein [Phaeoacremonium minimum UCRPA7]EON99139.1 putative zinc-binding dehydrogenase protein [Phaeoacremonium minimum UCRPA7]